MGRPRPARGDKPIIIELSAGSTDMVVDLARRHRCDPADVATVLLDLGVATLQSTSGALARLPVLPDQGNEQPIGRAGNTGQGQVWPRPVAGRWAWSTLAGVVRKSFRLPAVRPMPPNAIPRVNVR